MTQQMPEAVFWCLALGLLAVTVLLVRQRGITALVRRRNAELADGLRARDEEVRHLASVRLPALEGGAGGGAGAPGAAEQAVPGVGLLDPRLAGTGFAKSVDEVLDRFAGAVEQAQARADAAAKAALKTSMRAVQALANEQQVAISQMQDRHDHPGVLRDLLEIDHANAQFGRRAQAIAVLCGSWPGRQRAASALTDVVRGATSRIRDYRRVEVHGHVDIAVESRAVEPAVLAVAELLDNAARHSQPNTKVEVNLRAVHNGACIVIDDAGVGMDGQAADRASVLLSGGQSVDVTRLDDPPQFGFAVIGALAARYGFGVTADTRSPYGGVRAVVFLPSSLLTHVTEEPEPAPAEPDHAATPQSAPPPEPQPAGASATESAGASATESAPPSRDAAHAPQDAAAGDTTAGGLPKRRRRAPQQSRSAPPAELPTADEASRTAEETAVRMGAFARGTRSGRDARLDGHDEGKTQG
ncbi:ATP-binding protein [Streptomyces sp. HNM0663]|uniref:histidine kinase n=1 Tax=Streptomyces chengmaiensis TaxID=3040919 RepID=A0ABT6HSQ3_9ACTN|nr:ATP-binding protein [Streptomyces chengmaiensis]MDH2390904.1 ATP-binding protein [Streptomyces chengmaiensis]